MRTELMFDAIPKAVRGLVLLFLCFATASCGGEEIKWTEEVKLRDGKVVQINRRTALTSGGFPVSKRGFHTYHELCYAPLRVYWKSKPEYRPEIFELDGGKAFVKVTLGSFNTCGRHGYPKDSALYFVWSGTEWSPISAAQFPNGARLNLLQNPMGITSADDARGKVDQTEKERRDSGLYYALQKLGVSSMNEIPPYKGMCSKHPVEKLPPPVATDIFMPSKSRTCD